MVGEPPNPTLDGVDSPFHPGEREVQERVGFREKIEPFGRGAIRNFMPDQHRAFFEQLPWLCVGAADPRGRLWASMLVGDPGFIQAPDPQRLQVAAAPGFGDPLRDAWRDGAPVGALGIELHTRRRNRVNGVITLGADGAAFSLAVDQSFGNCPQYIHARQPRFVRAATQQAEPRPVRHFTTLDDRALGILARADTFFVASQFGGGSKDTRQGVDVSHRGGRTGVLTVRDAKSLAWPDYRGNFFFNTLGNLALNPRCGLLVIDFDSGDTLQLTGTAEIVWEFERADPALRDAERLIQFDLEAGVHIEGASPFSWAFQSVAPQFTRS